MPSRMQELFNRMQNYGEERPRPAALLYKSLVSGKKRAEVLELLARGCDQILKNARRLAGDVECLLREKRFASASVLAVTVEEELAKVLLLIDLAKLDFIKHVSIANELCQAFCSHAAKAARYSVYRDRGSIASLSDLKTQVTNAKIEWFPGDEECPDIASNATLRRDFALYADMSWVNGEWYMPLDEEYSDAFETASASASQWGDATQVLREFEENLADGVFSHPTISTIHRVFAPVFLGEREGTQFTHLNGELAKELLRKGLATTEALKHADVLNAPPAYAFIGKRLKNLRGQ